MATPSIRGHQGRIKLFSNGQPTGIVTITRFEVNQDSSFIRTNYVGQSIPEGDQAMEGWSGSIDLEVKDDSVDAMIDSLVQGNLAGIGVDDITMILDELYPNGQVSSYVYVDMQFKMSKTNSGLNEKMTKRLEFQASYRTKL